MYGDTDYQRLLSTSWSGNAATTGIYRDPRYGSPAFFAQWDSDSGAPKLTLTNRIATRDRSVDLSRSGVAQPLPRSEFDLYVASTAHIPTDGIVRATANRILPLAAGNPVERARAIYEWIVANTYRDPKVLGCGTGDIRFMLETNNLGGKCADLNALFVGLARSVGIPARDVYGVRVADSATCKSLGRSGASPRRSIAARNPTMLASAGYPSIPPTSARSWSKKPATRRCRSTIPASISRAGRSSGNGK